MINKNLIFLNICFCWITYLAIIINKELRALSDLWFSGMLGKIKISSESG